MSEQRIGPATDGRTVLVGIAGLVGRPVVNPSGDEVGRLLDVVVRWDDETYPAVSGLVLRVGRRRTFLHSSQLGRFDQRSVQLRSARVVLEEFERRDGEVLLVADVMDHQLVDVTGARVVRAADLYVAEFGGERRLVAVDVGLRALARRMIPGRGPQAAKPDAVLDWAAVQPFTEPDGRVRLREPGRRLELLRPDQLADLLDDLGRNERRSLLAHLDAATAADVLEEASPEDAAQLLQEVDPDRAAHLLMAMEPDEAVETLRELDDDDRAELLGHLTSAEAHHFETLLAFPEETAGGLMNTTIVLVQADDTVDGVRQRLQALAEHGNSTDAVTVVDDGGQVVDDIGLFELFVADPDATMGSLCGPPYPVVAGVDTELSEVVERFIDQRASSIVVVDLEGRPVGRIYADDIVDALFPAAEREGPFH